jgi:hypothetical protein
MYTIIPRHTEQESAETLEFRQIDTAGKTAKVALK